MPEVILERRDEELDDLLIFPITDIENNNDGGGDYDPYGRASSREGMIIDNQSYRPSLTLRQRRYSQLGLGNGPLLKVNVLAKPEPVVIKFNARHMWKKALRLIHSLKDPWEAFAIDTLPTEKVIRHRYNALKKKWKKDEVNVKMEKESFNRGAMRSCFRMKKLSTFSRCQDWKNATNYVAKSYMEVVDRDVYFADVKLQMDAKLWGEEYNRHNPPKKVDIFQMCVIEFVERPGKPLYHLEHFIEGEYIKYNSNSGFVEDSVRLTPQAFSHFTFERSGHQLIVVDIQGVGDLWTDPQIHTAKGDEYGDGNLGGKGMALFFHSHACNSICETFKLSKFDLSASEEGSLDKFIKLQADAMTRVRGVEEMCVSASPTERVDLTEFLAHSRVRCRTISNCSVGMEEDGMGFPAVDSPLLARRRVGFQLPPGTPRSRVNSLEDDPMSVDSPSSPLAMPLSPVKPRSRVRFLSESDDSASATLTELSDRELTYLREKHRSAALEEDDDSDDDELSTEEERIRFQQCVSRGARPSCVAHEINLRNLQEDKRMGDSFLGQIHHELAKYHEMGRFVVNEGEIDMKAAVYHEQQAAELGVKDAILTMAHLYLGLPHDVLVSVTVESTEDNINQGVDYMLYAAETGDRSAMVYMAKAFETGIGLGTDRARSYERAVYWYEQAINKTSIDESGEFDATMQDPVYQLKAKMAELYLEGGLGLNPDPSWAGDLYNEAAEEAMAATKGRLANKYYALSEEAYAQVEEE